MTMSMKALGAGVWDYDVSADELYCSDNWYAMMGIDPAETPVRSLDDFRRFVHPEDVGTIPQIDLDRFDKMADGDEPHHIEYRVVRPDGVVRRMRSVACVVRDAETGSRRAVGCILDVTGWTSDPLAELPDVPATPAEPSGVLSGMERECLTWVAAGKTAWETAVILDRSRKTVEFHLANAARKLGATNKVHAAALAIRQGLL